MSRFVRSSKFRHVFGTAAKKEECYDDLRIAPIAWDTNFIAGNPLFISVIWDSAGGSFAILPVKDKGEYVVNGKVNPKIPLISGHKNSVLDLDFNPFNDSLIASVSEDGTGKIWGIPEGGVKETTTSPLQTLSGHKRKVGTVKFHPVANNILATSSADFSVKIWDIEKGKDVLSVDAQHADLILTCEWNSNGSLIATSCKDKKHRILDPRQNKVSMEFDGHTGIKGSRAMFVKDKFFSVGFSKNAEREYFLFDPRDTSKPLIRAGLDTASGVIMPFYDPDTSILFLAGKGDGNIRYYEVVDEAPYLHFLTEYKSATPQRGMAMMPKRACNVSDCEIARILKLGTKLLEPISFQVPRKSDIFQDDIFPDCPSGEPALMADEWVSGKNAEPKLMSMAPGFVQKKTVIEFNPEKVEEKTLSEKEIRDEYEKLLKRVAFLEAEIVKKDKLIASLQG